MGHKKKSDRLLCLLVVPVLLISVAPVVRLAAEGFLVNGLPSLARIGDVLGGEEPWLAAMHSLYCAGLGTMISLLLGGAFAFLVGLTDVRGTSALGFCFMIPLMIPPQITALSWLQVSGPGSALLNAVGLASSVGSPQPLYSANGIAVLLGLQQAPIVFLTVRAAVRALPRDQIEAARLAAGTRSRWAAGVRLWWRIILPLASPGVIAGTALAFVTALGNFGIQALLGIPAGYTTLPTLMYQKLAGFGPSVLGEVSVLAMMVGMLSMAGVAVHHHLLQSRDYQLTGDGNHPPSMRLGRCRVSVEIALWAVLVAILLVPLLALVASALVPAFGVRLTLSTLTLDAFREVLFAQPVMVRAFFNSLSLSLGAAFTLVILCLPLAYGIVRRPSALTRAMNLLVEIPYALPGVVLAIACILMFIHIPLLHIRLYGTIWIIFMAYLARFLVIALRPVMTSLVSLDPALEEAAQSCGAGMGRRVRDILLPLAAPAAAAGGVLVFLTAFNELTVSALLWSAGNETLGVLIFNLDEGGDSVMASACAVLVVVCVIALMSVFQGVARWLPRGVVPWQT